MRSVLSFLLLAGSCLVVSCSTFTSEKELPILGRREITMKEVNGAEVPDTTYHTIAGFRFLNQDSTWITNETFDGKVYVADFFFTSCPTICPIMKTQMVRIYEEFEGNSEVALLSHSIDPEHDSVAVLRDFSERLGVESSQWHFVTGDKDDIYDLGETSYMVVAGEDETAPGGYIHSGAFLLVDKQRRIRGVYDGTIEEEVDQLIKDIKKLLNEDKKSS